MNSSHDKHSQFIQEIRKPLLAPDKEKGASDSIWANLEDDYDLQAQLEKKFDELFGNKKKSNS